MAKSLPYHDFLISQLKDPSYAALYLETHFEEEENIESELLQLALSHVAEALGEKNMSPQEAKIHRENLSDLLSKPANEAIYSLATWLKALGLKLTVTLCEQPEDTVINTTIKSKVTV